MNHACEFESIKHLASIYEQVDQYAPGLHYKARDEHTEKHVVPRRLARYACCSPEIGLCSKPVGGMELVEMIFSLSCASLVVLLPPTDRFGCLLFGVYQDMESLIQFIL